MKTCLICLLAWLPGIALAQDSTNLGFGDLNQAQIQAALQLAQKVVGCMNEVDQAQLTALQTEAEAKAEEVRKMCAAGNRDAAQAEALSYGKVLLDKPVTLEFKACMGMASLSIPLGLWTQLENQGASQAHICDL